MTILADVRAALAALLAGVTGIGQVHDYFRLVTDEVTAKARFVTGGRLHAWMVTLADDEAYEEALATGARCRRIRARFAVHGYYAVDDADASEKAFETVLQAVIDALREDHTLGGVVIVAMPPRVREFTHRTFATVLCHYTRIELDVHAEVTT